MKPAPETDVERIVSHTLYLQRVCRCMLREALQRAREQGVMVQVPDEALQVVDLCLDVPSDEAGARAKMLCAELSPVKGHLLGVDDLSASLRALAGTVLSVARYRTGQGALFDIMGDASHLHSAKFRAMAIGRSRDSLIAEQVAKGAGHAFGLASSISLSLGGPGEWVVDALVVAATEGL